MYEWGRGVVLMEATFSSIILPLSFVGTSFDLDWILIGIVRKK